MIEKKTTINQIEVTQSGHVQVRFGLLIVEDGIEIDCKWHRTVISPGVDVDAQIAAVNAHLKSMGRPAVEIGRLGELKSIVAAAHTPRRVQEYRRAQESGS